MSNFLDKYDAAFVNAFDREYKEAKLEPRFMELPKGRYQFVVTDVKIVEQNNFNRQLEQDQYYEHELRITLKVISDDCKDALTVKRHGLCLGNIKRIKGDLSAMGHEFEGLAQLAEDIESGSMIGLIIDGHVTKKTDKKDPEKVYTNVWLDRCSGHMKPEEMGFTREDDDEEMPWG